VPAVVLGRVAVPTEFNWITAKQRPIGSVVGGVAVGAGALALSLINAVVTGLKIELPCLLMALKAAFRVRFGEPLRVGGVWEVATGAAQFSVKGVARTLFEAGLLGLVAFEAQFAFRSKGDQLWPPGGVGSVARGAVAFTEGLMDHLFVEILAPVEVAARAEFLRIQLEVGLVIRRMGAVATGAEPFFVRLVLDRERHLPLAVLVASCAELLLGQRGQMLVLGEVRIVAVGALFIRERLMYRLERPLRDLLLVAIITKLVLRSRELGFLAQVMFLVTDGALSLCHWGVDFLPLLLGSGGAEARELVVADDALLPGRNRQRRLGLQ